VRMVSLFSGCGGLDLGLSQAGFETVLACDNDSAAVASYRANFPDVAVYEGSVSDLNSDVMAETSGGATREQIDLLAGGPPCPPFSKSRFYRKDKPRALSDELGAETIGGFLRILRLLKPRAFLLENVAGMAYKVHRDALDHIVSTAAQLGYQCHWEVINAADYGVPQIRERFFLVGMLEQTFEFPTPTHAESPIGGLFGRCLDRWVTAGEAIGDLDSERNADDGGHFAGGKHHDLLKEVPPGENYLFFTGERGYPTPLFRWRSRYWSFLLKLSPDKPSWTIQARRSNNMGPFHWRNRILRIEEIKRLQTFPDHWTLSGTTEQQWRQVGNAVPPLLARHLGRALRKQLGTLGEHCSAE